MAKKKTPVMWIVKSNVTFLLRKKKIPKPKK